MLGSAGSVIDARLMHLAPFGMLDLTLRLPEVCPFSFGMSEDVHPPTALDGPDEKTASASSSGPTSSLQAQSTAYSLGRPGVSLIFLVPLLTIMLLGSLSTEEGRATNLSGDA